MLSAVEVVRRGFAMVQYLFLSMSRRLQVSCMFSSLLKLIVWCDITFYVLFVWLVNAVNSWTITCSTVCQGFPMTLVSLTGCFFVRHVSCDDSKTWHCAGKDLWTVLFDYCCRLQSPGQCQRWMHLKTLFGYGVITFSPLEFKDFCSSKEVLTGSLPACVSAHFRLFIYVSTTLC